MKPSLKNLIIKGKFDYVNPDITEELFPLPAEISNEYKLFHFDRYISSEDAITEMNKEGYRPAHIYELLSYDWNGEDLVIALGSVGEVSGRRSVVCLSRHGSERGLRLSWWVGDWDADYRFLGVRNSYSKTLETGTSDTLSLEYRVKSLEEDMNKLKKFLII